MALKRVVLNAFDPVELGAFYCDSLAFAKTSEGRFRLGDTILEIRRVSSTSAACPDDVPGWSPWFQHCAITVDDMDAAFARLARSTGWRAITRGGPRALPASSGGVVAFKFRDPEGHPLELLHLPDARASPRDRSASPFLRIDHSAISVADVGRSIAFYETMGLTVAARTVNRGIEQEQLDDVADPVVDIVTLAFPAQSGPHVELLHYRGAFDRPQVPLAVDAIAATTMVFGGPVASRMLDPDGHHLAIEPG